MIYKISSYLFEQLYKEKIVAEEEKEIYEYGFQITMANIINFVIMLTIGGVSGSLSEMVLFYLIFVSLRCYCGGYHADSYSKCFLMFGMTCILCLGIKHLVMSYEHYLTIFLMIPLLLQGGCIYIMAPIEHKNRPFSPIERSLFRKKSWMIYSFWLGIGFILAVIKQWEFVCVLLATFILVSIFMLIEKIGGNRHGKEKEST